MLSAVSSMLFDYDVDKTRSSDVSAPATAVRGGMRGFESPASF